MVFCSPRWHLVKVHALVSFLTGDGSVSSFTLHHCRDDLLFIGSHDGELHTV